MQPLRRIGIAVLSGFFVGGCRAGRVAVWPGSGRANVEAVAGGRSLRPRRARRPSWSLRPRWSTRRSSRSNVSRCRSPTCRRSIGPSIGPRTCRSRGWSRRSSTRPGRIRNAPPSRRRSIGRSPGWSASRSPSTKRCYQAVPVHEERGENRLSDALHARDRDQGSDPDGPAMRHRDGPRDQDASRRRAAIVLRDAEGARHDDGPLVTCRHTCGHRCGSGCGACGGVTACVQYRPVTTCVDQQVAVTKPVVRHVPETITVPRQRTTYTPVKETIQVPRGEGREDSASRSSSA